MLDPTGNHLVGWGGGRTFPIESRRPRVFISLFVTADPTMLRCQTITTVNQKATLLCNIKKSQQWQMVLRNIWIASIKRSYNCNCNISRNCTHQIPVELSWHSSIIVCWPCLFGARCRSMGQFGASPALIWGQFGMMVVWVVSLGSDWDQYGNTC